MVQIHFESVIQAEPRIRLNDLPQNAPDHIRLELVTASETNAHYLTLDILSVAYS